MTSPRESLESADEPAVSPPASPVSSPNSEFWLTVGRPVTPVVRGALAAAGVALLAGFCLAASLEPDPRGYGTHQRLGFPECSFRYLFAIPCPGCGMTTCFAHFVRGNWSAAWQANPAGVWMACGCVAVMLWCWVSAILGRLWCVDDPWVVLACLMGSWGVTSVIVWGWRIW
jgi:hypothetical protein